MHTMNISIKELIETGKYKRGVVINSHSLNYSTGYVESGHYA